MSAFFIDYLYYPIQIIMLSTKIIRNTTKLILALLFILPTLPNLNLGTIPGAFNYLQQLIPPFLLLCCCVIFIVYFSKHELLVNSALIWPVIFVILFLLQYAYHGSPYFATYLTDISIFIVLFFGIIALTNILTNQEIINISAVAIILSGYIQVILSVCQLSGFTINSIITIYDNATPYYLLIKWLQMPGYQRITGGIGQPNELADFLTWAILATIFIFQNKNTLIQKLFCWFTIFIFAIFIALTQSRTAYFYPLVIITYALILNHFCKKKPAFLVRQLIFSSIIMIIMMILVKLGITQFLTSTSSNALQQVQLDKSLAIDRVVSTTQRFVMWAKGLEMFLAHPFLGIGWDKYPLYFITTPLPNYVHYVHGEMATINNCHNLFIQFLATTGITGTGILLAWITYTISSLWKQPLEQQFFPMGMLLVVLTHSQFEFPLFKVYILTMVAIIVVSQNNNYLTFPTSAIKIKLFLILICIIGFWQIYQGGRNYLLLAKVIPPQNYQQNRPTNNILHRYAMVATNPWWDDYADLDLATDLMYDVKTAQNRANFTALHSVLKRICSYFPHPALVLKLSILDEITGNHKEAYYWIRQMNTNYIGFESTFATYITQLTPDVPQIRQHLLNEINNNSSLGIESIVPVQQLRHK